MAEHDKANHDNIVDVKKKHRTSRQEIQPASDQSLTRDTGPFSLMETPFSPRIGEHAAMLSNIPFSAQRQEFIMRLHHTYGSNYVQRLVESVNAQAKLTVSDPNDVYEQEPDRVAGEVTRSMNNPVQRQVPEDEDDLQAKPLLQREEDDEDLQAKLAGSIQKQDEDEKLQAQRQDEEEDVQMQADDTATATVAGDIETRIDSARGGGQPLSNDIKTPMEHAFDADFSGVRTHTDAEADTLNRELSAKAFTTGQDVFFREGEYSPGSDSGRKLVAHELTHVVQQNPNTIMRMANPPAVLAQTGGTCGLYSLCMGIQAIDNGTWSNKEELLKELVDAALEQGTGIGEEFSVQQIVLLATRLGYQAEIVQFRDENDLVNTLKQTGTKAVLMAWSVAEKSGLGDEWKSALAAHWSVVANYDNGTGQLTIYNPWGQIDKPTIADFYKWNMQLEQDAPFAFKDYAKQEISDNKIKSAAEGKTLRKYMEDEGIIFDAITAQKASDWSVTEEEATVIVGLMKDLEEVITKYGSTETAPEIMKLPERKVNLAGQFVTISGTGLGKGNRLKMLIKRPYEK